MYPSYILCLAVGAFKSKANASNEEAVFAFLENKIKFLDIYKITKEVFDSYKPIFNADIDTILEEDEKVRTKTKELIEKYKRG